MAKRKIIIHYHIFKNAGTSIDCMLELSFGDRWKAWDGTDPNSKISPAEMEDFILSQPDLQAVSSHQVVPPLPNRYLDVYPIVFLRHPIDRAYSAYLFEWKKQKGTEQPTGRFEAYVAEKFAYPRRNAIEDFQALHLANRGYESHWPSEQLDDEEILRDAKDFLLSLPCFGLVEDYAGSLAQYKLCLSEPFPELIFLQFHDNVLQNPDLSIFDKIRELRNSIAPETFQQLVLRNQLDLRLYEFATARFACRTMPANYTTGQAESNHALELPTQKWHRKVGQAIKRLFS